jgi:nucleotide-binding universal stress UspA family protein
MRTILVAIDGSDIAMRALDFAAAQAVLRPTARLHALMVQPVVAVYGEAAAYASEDAMRTRAAADCRAVLESARERLAGKTTALELELLEGDPAETIVRRARELACESIVMGTHGRGRLGQTLLGSVAQRVVHMSEIPVTLVR